MSSQIGTPQGAEIADRRSVIGGKASARPLVGVERAMEGARILWRYFLSTQPAREGGVREFSADGARVRISKTDGARDAGRWHRCYELVVEAVLDPARAPAVAEVPPAVAGFIDFTGGEGA